MPPQVQRTDPGTPVNSQVPVSTEQSKAAEVDKNAAQKPEPPKQDAQTAAKNAEAARQHAKGLKYQDTARVQIMKNELAQKIPEKKAPTEDVQKNPPGSPQTLKDQLAEKIAKGADGPKILKENAPVQAGPTQVQMSAPVGAPAELPGRQMTVTIYDANDKPLATQTVPLRSEVETNTFFGEIKGGSIDWGEGNKVNVRIGQKVDKTGKPSDAGVPIEQWVGEKGKGQARYVKVEISGAMLEEGKAAGKGTSSPASTAAKHSPAGKGSVGESAGTPGGTSKKSTATGNGAPVENARPGTVSKEGRDAAPGAEKKGVAGGTDTGEVRNTPGTHKDGKVTGKADGNKKETGYFHDPTKTGKGQEDIKRKNAEAGGMVGGEGKKGDEGTTTGGGVLGMISLPKGVGAAVALSMILADANIVGAGDGMIEKALKLGKKGGGQASDALKTAVKHEFDDLVSKEMDTLASNLKKDPAFTALGPEEQAKALVKAKEGLEEAAHGKVVFDMDRRIAEAEKYIKEAKANPGKYSKDVIEEQEKIAGAARQAKDAMPPPKKSPVNTSNVESPANPNSPGRASTQQAPAAKDALPSPKALREAREAFRTDKDFKKWFHKEYKPDVKNTTRGSAPGASNPDIDLVEGYAAWIGEGKPKAK